MIYLPEQRVLFVHNPKTAGTSIGTWLQENFKTVVGRKHANIIEGRDFFPDVQMCFGVVRNPLDRLVSWHKFSNDTSKVDFREWVVDQCFRHQPSLSFNPARTWAKNWYTLSTPQSDWFDKDCKVLKYETLANDFIEIQKILGCNKPLPVLNSTYREDYKTYYDNELAELVRDIYLKDIIRFEY
jgi:hypothetical protein